MKWSTEKTEQLTKLCFKGKGNKEISEILGISVSDVHAKRSQLGITISKVKSAKGMIEKPEFANLGKTLDLLHVKAHFIKSLVRPLKMADGNIRNLALSADGNMVVISFNNGAQKAVNIECDSYLAIILDVVGSLR